MDRNESTLHAWNKLATAYQDKFMDLDLYNDTYDRFCQLVEKTNARILEIGCGPGNITRYLLSVRPDFKILGTDMAPAMVERAKENIPQAAFAVMDAREAGTLNEKFDAIVCGFCLPYLSKEETAKLIADAAGLLTENGVLYFSCIEGDYQQSGFETSSDGTVKMFVYRHEENYLKQFLIESNFGQMELIRKTYQRSATETNVHLIFLAKKR